MDTRVGGVAASISTLQLDLRNEGLWWGGQQIGLTPKTFALLRYLVEHKDRLVTKQALLEAVWPDTYVEEGQVKQFVADLRKILHDDASAPRFIETVRGRGYRLIGDIALRSPELNLVARAGRPASPGNQSPRAQSSEIQVSGASAGQGQTEAAQRSGFLASLSKPSIAVLPFRKLGADGGADFAEALTEGVIDGLARSRSVSVIARQSTLKYRDCRAHTRDIAAELGAGYILDGTVQYRASRLRISASLVDAAQERTIWAERYDGAEDERFRFQDRAASSIVAAIEPRLFEAEITRIRWRPAQTFDAYDCVLRAASLLYTFDEHDLRSAGAYLDRAIELDAASARAHAYQAWWYLLCIGEARSSDPA